MFKFCVQTSGLTLASDTQGIHQSECRSVRSAHYKSDLIKHAASKLVTECRCSVVSKINHHRGIKDLSKFVIRSMSQKKINYLRRHSTVQSVKKERSDLEKKRCCILKFEEGSHWKEKCFSYSKVENSPFSMPICFLGYSRLNKS